MIQKSGNRRLSYILFIIVMSVYIISVFALKDRNDLTFLLMLILIVIIFFVSSSNMKLMADRVLTFLFPISLGITRCIWIAHPRTESTGILQVGAGLFVSMTDIVILYFAFRGARFKPQKKNALSKTVIVFFATVLVSCIFANEFEFSLAGILLYLKCFVVYRWFFTYANMKRIQRPLLQGTEVALLIQGIVASLQKIKNGVIGLEALGEADEAMRYRLVGGVIERSPAGLFEHSSRLAVFTIFALLLILFCEERKIKKYILLAFGTYVLFIAAARTAIIAVFIALIYGLWRNRARLFRRRNLVLIIIGIILLIFGGIYLVRNNILDFFTSSDILYQIGNRFSQWNLAFSYISKRMGIIGYGINNYTSVTTGTGLVEFIYLNPVHNNYILYWFELGIVGFVAYIMIYVFSFKQGRKYKEFSQIGKSAFLFILCTLIYNFIGWAFAAPTCIYMLWASIGIVCKEDH